MQAQLHVLQKGSTQHTVSERSGMWSDLRHRMEVMGRGMAAFLTKVNFFRFIVLRIFREKKILLSTRGIKKASFRAALG